MTNRFQRYLLHQAHVMQLYVQRRQSEGSALGVEELCSEWVSCYAEEYRNRFGRYLG